MFAKAPECQIKCQGYPHDFCCGEFCERLIMNKKADASFNRLKDAVSLMYGQCAQCGGNLTTDHRCPETGMEDRVDYKFNEALLSPHVEMHYADYHTHQCVHKVTYDALARDALNLIRTISNQSARIDEFDLCIHRVAEALGACCGGVDGDQTREGSTTRVLLEKISALKAVPPRVQEARDFIHGRRGKLLDTPAPRSECPGCFCAIYDGARTQGWCVDCYPCCDKYLALHSALPDGVSI